MLIQIRCRPVTEFLAYKIERIDDKPETLVVINNIACSAAKTTITLFGSHLSATIMPTATQGRHKSHSVYSAGTASPRLLRRRPGEDTAPSEKCKNRIKVRSTKVWRRALLPLHSLKEPTWLPTTWAIWAANARRGALLENLPALSRRRSAAHPYPVVGDETFFSRVNVLSRSTSTRVRGSAGHAILAGAMLTLQTFPL